MEHDESSSVREESATPSSGERELSALDAAAPEPAQKAESDASSEAAFSTEAAPGAEAALSGEAVAGVEVEPPTVKAGSGEYPHASEPALDAEAARDTWNGAEAPTEQESKGADSAQGQVEPTALETPGLQNEDGASEAGASQAGASQDGASEAGASEAGASEAGASEASASDEGPASEEVPTERAPNVEAKLETDVETAVVASEESGADSAASASAVADRDSVIPIESRDFVVDSPERQRRLPRAPARPQAHAQASPQGTEWLDDLPHSSGTPTLAALVQRSESERPPTPSIPSELLANHGFDLGTHDWDVPLVRTPTSDAPVVNGSEAPRPAATNRTSMAVVIAAVAAAAFAAGLSVRRPAPVVTGTEPTTHRIVETSPNIQAAKPALAVAPPEFAIEPAAPEQSPASLPLAVVPAKSAEAGEAAKPEVAPPSAAAAPDVASTAPPANAATTPVAAVQVSAPTAARAAEVAPATPRAETADAKPTKAKQSPEPAAEEQPAGAAFDARAAESAITAAASRAASCKQPGDPSGVAVVTITFSPSGRATTANVAGEPFAGTATGGCIAATLRAARVPAFSGDYVTVKKTVKID